MFSFLLKQYSKRSSIIRFFIISSIAALCCFVFYPLLDHDFLYNWDDQMYVVFNDHIREISRQSVFASFTSFHFGNYHPFTTLFTMAEWSVFRNNPMPYHAVQLIIHLMNVFVVFRLSLLLTERTMAAGIVAFLFALHPMHVESVAWISELKDVLFSFFYLTALLMYVRYIKNGYSFRVLLFAHILFLFSLLSKSMAITFPLALLVLDYRFRRISFSTATWGRKIISEKIFFFLLSVAFGIVAYISQTTGKTIVDIPSYNIPDRFFLACYAVSAYIVKLFFPFLLSAIHYFPDKVNDHLPFIYYLSPIGVMIVLFILKKLNVMKHEIVSGCLFFIVTLFPVIQIIPFGNAVISERYTYIPYLGLFFIIGCFVSSVFEKRFYFFANIKPYVIIALITFGFFFTALSAARVNVWKNGVTLFSDVVNKYPEKSHAYYLRGVAYSHYRDHVSAMKDYQTAAKLKERWAAPYFNMGVIYETQHHYPNAIFCFSKAIEADSSSAEAWFHRATAWGLAARFSNAIYDYTKAIEANPENSLAYFNRGQAYFYTGNIEKACKDWNKASTSGYKPAEEKIKIYCVK